MCSTPQIRGVCDQHQSPIAQAFVVSQRAGVLRELNDGFKFHNVKEAARVLAQLLDEYLPILPPNIQIVPIPTTTSHIRQRGYDHIDLIARHLSYLRNIPVKRILSRQTNTTQHTVGRTQRQEQAKQAFMLTEHINGPILLLDDIITTGSTVLAASKSLSNSGSVVFVASLAYQPLD
ncbi:MAG: hypothetical protein WAR37_02440 [Candidatus Microsaccharimonas sp.]